MQGFGPEGLWPWGVPPEEFATGGPLLRPVLVAGGDPRAAVPLLELQVADSGLAGALPAPILLIAADALGADVAVARAHTASGATSLERLADGTYTEVGQNLPRYDYAARLPRVDGGEKNWIANPRFLGGAAPSTEPTGMDLIATVGGVTMAIGGTGTQDGRPYIDITLSGTASSSATGSFYFETSSTAIAAAFGEDWTVSAWLSGSGTMPTTRLTIQQLGATTPTSQTGPLTITSTPARLSYSLALNVATVTHIRAGYRITTASGTNYSGTTIRLSAPVLTKAAAAGAPMLSAVGSPGVSERAADVPAWAPSQFPARGCILLRGTLDALAGATALGLVQIDDGTDSNRVVARVDAGGGTASCRVIVGGVTTATLTPAVALAAGAEFRLLVAWSPGGVRFGIAGAAVVSVATARPTGLLRALLGQADAAGTTPMVGVLAAEFYPIWPSEAEAAALLAA